MVKHLWQPLARQMLRIGRRCSSKATWQLRTSNLKFECKRKYAKRKLIAVCCDLAFVLSFCRQRKMIVTMAMFLIASSDSVQGLLRFWNLWKLRILKSIFPGLDFLERHFIPCWIHFMDSFRYSWQVRAEMVTVTPPSSEWNWDGQVSLLSILILERLAYLNTNTNVISFFFKMRKPGLQLRMLLEFGGLVKWNRNHKLKAHKHMFLES